MRELQVGLGERSYPIRIGQGSLTAVGADLKERNIANRYCVISDDRVAALYSEKLMASLAQAGLQAELVTFPHGEPSKTLQTVAELASRLAQLGFDRKDAIIALGGGVVGDIAGFLASSYMRGIPFVQIPTTLLAQVDSSVGGKTGVDIPEGKNLVGAFYQPKAVFIDCDVLNTLPREELLGGLGEVIKYGVIRDGAFFDYLHENREQILAVDPAVIEEVIYICCKIKAEVVAEDEKESNVRRILNYGHTLGHAVEAASGFTLIHGLAVSIGMVAAAKLSVLNGLLSTEEQDKIVQLLVDYDLPTVVPAELDRNQIIDYLQVDKKIVAGRVFYVLPTSIGSTLITDKITHEQIVEVLQ